MATDRPGGRADATWVVHGERSLYASRWVRLNLVDVEPPGGERFEHHVVRMQRVAVVLVANDEQDAVLMLRRHRFIDDSWGWEVPVGIVEDDETPEQAAYRECQEETGWRPVRLTRTLAFQPAIGIADSPHELFMSVGAVRVSDELDPSEAQAVEWIGLDDVRHLLSTGEVRDAASLVAVLHLLARHRGP